MNETVRVRRHIVFIVSVMLLIAGTVALYSVYFPRWTKVPTTSVILWAGPFQSLTFVETRIIVDLTPRQEITFYYVLNISEAATYQFDIWLPYRVSSVSSSLSNNTGTAFLPVMTHFLDGTTWVRCTTTLNPASGTNLALRLGVSSLFSIHEPGKDQVILTFSGGPITDQVTKHIYPAIRSSQSYEVLYQAKPLVVDALLPPNSVLSLDSFPAPAQLQYSGEAIWVRWLFTFGNYGDSKSLVISVLYPNWLDYWRDLYILSGGILLSTGSGGLFEALRESARGSKSSSLNVPRHRQYLEAH